MAMKKILFALFACVIATAAIAQFSGSWQILFSQGLPSSPQAQGKGWVISLSGKQELDYVMRSGDAFKRARSIRVTMQFSGGFVVPEGGAPKVTVMLWRRGDTLTGQGKYEQYRLWYGPGRIAMVQGNIVTVDIPMSKSGWTGVFGQAATNGSFADMIKNLDRVGLTFGGNFYGHGVRSTSSSKIILVGFEAR